MKKIKGVIVNWLNFIFKYITYIIPKKKNRWVFGSWYGESYNDNSKYLYEYVLKSAKDIEAIWISKDEKIIYKINESGGKAIKYGTLRSYIYLLSAEATFITQTYEDLAPLFILGNSYNVQLWHGVALKKIGFDGNEMNTNSLLKKINRYIVKKWRTADLYIAPSNEYKNKLKSAFDIDDSIILDVGQPRNEMFFDRNNLLQDRFIKNIDKKINIDLTKNTIVTYMPTFRDKNNTNFSFLNLNKDEQNRIEKICEENNVIIIEKSHYINNKNSQNNSSFKNIININNVANIDTQELLSITDILITDYSSCFFDFLLLDRPIIHFVYDYNYYKNIDRGLYYDIEEVSCGAIAYNFDEMINELEESIKNPQKNQLIRSEIKNKFVEFENKNNCKMIVDYVKSKIK